MSSERYLIIFQFIASLFMATDYFLDEKQRRYINVNMRIKLRRVKLNIKTDIYGRTEKIRFLSRDFFVATLLWIIFWLLAFWLPSTVPPSWRDATSLLGLLPGFMLAFRYWKPQLDFIVELMQLCISFLPLTGVIFLMRCPKGTVFGIGYFILICTFLVRFEKA